MPSQSVLEQKKAIVAELSERLKSSITGVVVSYEGRLANGQIFDSSANQPNGQVGMKLTKTIKGWQVALPKMTVGSTWEIYIPYSMGYGETGTGPIPPFATLIFKITLVK